MPLPGGLTPITVTGTFLRATGYSDTNGTPETGSVSFKLKYLIADGVNNKVLTPSVVTRELDAAGSFSVVLPATNNTAVSPTGWTYEVKVKVSTGVQTFDITVDKDAAGATVDLADILPTSTPLTPTFYIPIAQRGAANGVATLGADGLVPAGQLPVTGGGIPSSLVDAKGDLIVATADGVVARKARGTDGQVLSTNSATVDGLEWVDNSGGGAVDSVNGETGAVVLSAADVDAEPEITAGTTGQYWRGDKSWQTLDKTAVGLANVDNTSDANKPVSTATQTALNLKANLASPTFTGTVSGITKSMVGLANADNTSDVNKPISLATQAALDLKADLVGGLVPSAQIPAIAITEFLGTAANQAAMLALSGQKGDFTVRTDTGTNWVITGTDPTQLASWTELSYPAAPVQSVNGQTGTVTLAKGDVGLGNADNTSDANKPVSTATQTALNLKAPLASPTFTGTVAGITKSMVGLANADNTSDANKPVSTATQTALDTKVDESLVTTKGDLLVATGANTLVRLPATTNGHVLTLDSAETAGLKWAAPSGGSGSAKIKPSAFVDSGNISIPDSAWTDVSGIDCAVPAAIGDLIIVYCNFMCDTSGSDIVFDAVTVVSGTFTTYFSSKTTTQRSPGGMGQWYVEAGKFIGPTAPSAPLPLVTGDISGGVVTVRLIAKAESGSRTVRRNTTFPLEWWIINHGPAAS